MDGGRRSVQRMTAHADRRMVHLRMRIRRYGLRGSIQLIPHFVHLRDARSVHLVCTMSEIPCSPHVPAPIASCATRWRRDGGRRPCSGHNNATVRSEHLMCVIPCHSLLRSSCSGRGSFQASRTERGTERIPGAAHAACRCVPRGWPCKWSASAAHPWSNWNRLSATKVSTAYGSSDLHLLRCKQRLFMRMVPHLTPLRAFLARIYAGVRVRRVVRCSLI